MSNYAQFKLSRKEKDDFYGFLIVSDAQTLRKTVKRISGNDSVFEFSLSTAFNTTTATFTDSFSLTQNGPLAFNATKFLTAADISISGIKFNSTGTSFYVCDTNNSRINRYNLTTAYDISTASYHSTFSTYDKEINPRDVAFSNDMLKMFVLGSAGNPDQGVEAPQVVQYTLASASDIVGATFSKRVTITDTAVKGLIFNATGTQMYVSGDTTNTTVARTLATAFDLATVTLDSSYDHTTSITNLRGIALNTAGTKLYAINNSANRVYEYPLNTAFNLVSIQPTNADFQFRTNNINVRNITFNPAGTKMFITGDAGVFQIDDGDDEAVYSHIPKVRNTIRAYEGNTYIFDVSDSSLLAHNFKFSTTSDGTFSGGTIYTTNVTTSGTVGTTGATVTIVIPKAADGLTAGSAVGDLFYFDDKHSKLGGLIATPQYKQNLKATFTNFVDDIQTRARTALQEDLFHRSYIFNSGTDLQVVNGDLVIIIS